MHKLFLLTSMIVVSVLKNPVLSIIGLAGLIIAIQERMEQNQVLHSGAKVDSLIGSANCVHMYPQSGLSHG